jgi:hypothetical protein
MPLSALPGLIAGTRAQGQGEVGPRGSTAAAQTAAPWARDGQAGSHV